MNKKNLNFHKKLDKTNLRLHILTKGGPISLTAKVDRRAEISTYIKDCISQKKLCVLDDIDGIPNAVCQGDKIIGFYFNFIEENTPYDQYLAAAIRYYNHMTESEGWRKGIDESETEELES